MHYKIIVILMCYISLLKSLSNITFFANITFANTC